MDQRWTQTPTASPDEIAVAVAHGDCMREHNLVGTWFAVESAYEQREIDANADALADIRKRIDATVAYAKATIGRS